MIEYRETLLKLTDVGYSVDGKVILRNINAEIKNIVGHGQIVALLAPSGVGKTTLFKLLSGIIKPTSGSIEIKTSEDKFTPPHEGIMGVVAQDYPLFDYATVLDNLRMVASKEKALEKLNHFGMIDQKDKYPCELSGGQKQRIATIQQILCSEKFILMDEPFSGLDPIAKCSVCKLIKETADHDESNTVIVVTHGIEDAIKVADTIWLLGRDTGIEGAYIKEVISLAEKGMSWKCCSTPQLAEMASYIMSKFKDL